MGKAKASKGVAKVSNRALHSRVSYLHQAAAYLATQQPLPELRPANSTKCIKGVEGSQELDLLKIPAVSVLSCRLLTDLRSVSMKAQIRISPMMKHSMCKYCDTILVDGSTCSAEVENKSKDGKKSWADVLVRKCMTCGVARRYPLAREKQRRRPDRLPHKQLATQAGHVD